ncbi:PucR family transcriptional regulator [Nocardia sp. NPDC050408]|uniref:PucR family transcriptional regulator n=1 Tax=unclassified Nocardia TaxID=2637762 RepID=UPI00342CE6A5
MRLIDPGLQRAAEALGTATHAQQTLHVIASSTSLWTWLANVTVDDAQALAAATSHIEGVRIAMGPPDTGVEGFRRSHLDAVETQRLMQRLPDLRFARFADVQLVTLATYNEQRAHEFVARTLGKVASADPELRETLRVYIREQFSTSRAARTLFAHRNTVLNRIQRAEELLPIPLDHNGLEIGGSPWRSRTGWVISRPTATIRRAEERGSPDGRQLMANARRDVAGTMSRGSARLLSHRSARSGRGCVRE